MATSARHLKVTRRLFEGMNYQDIEARLDVSLPNSPDIAPDDNLAVGCTTLLRKTMRHMQAASAPVSGACYSANNSNGTVQETLQPDIYWPPLQSQLCNPLMKKLFWASLWQGLFLATMHQRPLQVDAGLVRARSDLEEDDDGAWTNRILIHLLDTMQYCFGQERSPASYDRLISYTATWAESKPPSFRPIFIQCASGGSVFPTIYLLNDAVVASMQYYHLVRILLLAHNPRLPQFGMAKKSAKDARDVSGPRLPFLWTLIPKQV